ncbi:MAG: ABC transporter ATP-binding protein [Alphaproteobacteria bacterium]|nr:ABC transporter ATP-binding protein [Alphaproteobacteria bacterium]
MSDEKKQLWQDLISAFRLMTHNHKWMFWIMLGLYIIRGLMDLSLPIIGAIVLGKLQLQLNDTQLTISMLAWLVLSAISHPIYFHFSETVWDIHSSISEFYNNSLFVGMLRKVLRMPPLTLEGQQSAKIISTINSLNNTVSVLVVQIARWIGFFVPFVMSFVVLLATRWSYAAIALISWIVGTSLTHWILNRFSRDGELNIMQIKNGAEKTDQLDNLVNINALNLQDSIINTLYNRLEKYAKISLLIHLKLSLLTSIPVLILTIPLVVISIWAAYDVLETKDLGRFVLLTGMVSTFISRGVTLTGFWGFIVRQIKKYHKLMETLKYDTTLDLKMGKTQLPTGGSIELKKVRFTYPKEKIPVLDGLSLKIKQGERVAIIGNSGMGKSTLINVMQHAYEIQGGSVIINGKDVRKLSLKSLKDSITYINQHPIFWTEKNIRANLLMFNPKATEVELYQALNAANLLDEITRKEKGIDSKVTALSAGQKQRLALARAFLRHTPIVIMDEPTANLDTLAQSKVLQGIRLLNKNKNKTTVVFASNVPAEIACAERIILLEKGKVIEDGTPSQLMSDTTTQTYKRLKKYVALFNIPPKKTQHKKKGVKHG